MVDAPKISVCVLVYNHANVIESTLQTILDQSLEGFELVVSDDCSNDGTWEVLEAIQARNPRVRAIRTPHNMGMAGNANFAVHATTGKYIALLHHDDLYRSDLLAKWMESLECYDDIGFVFNEYRLEDSDVDLSEPIPDGRVEGKWLLEKYLFPRWGCPVRGTAMIRRSAWEQLGGMRVGADPDHGLPGPDCAAIDPAPVTISRRSQSHPPPDAGCGIHADPRRVRSCRVQLRVRTDGGHRSAHAHLAQLPARWIRGSLRDLVLAHRQPGSRTRVFWYAQVSGQSCTGVHRYGAGKK